MTMIKTIHAVNDEDIKKVDTTITETNGNNTKKHAFWDTQPMPRSELRSALPDGPILSTHQVSWLQDGPYTLPDGLVWSNICIKNKDELTEVYTLLTNNFVEDASFRYDYSSEFLLWALDPPNANPNFIFGFRSESTNELMGFISGMPTTTQANEHIFRAVLINFFCVHKELCSKRLAPILMKEMGRRVAPSGISQAIYEAGVVLPDPVASTRNHHRPLNPKKLIQVGFSQLGSNHRMTIERMQKVYKLPNEPITPRLRPMNVSDVEGVHKLVTSYLEQYSLKILFTMDEIRHWFLPRDKIMYSYVVDNNINGNNDENDCNKTITDFISFYHLPSSILHHADTSLYGAYSYYNVATTVPIEQLMQDALILAKNSGADVFNALDIMNNNQFFETLKFDISDGNLHYYIYNWTCKNMSPDQVGLVLL